MPRYPKLQKIMGFTIIVDQNLAFYINTDHKRLVAWFLSIFIIQDLYIRIKYSVGLKEFQKSSMTSNTE